MRKFEIEKCDFIGLKSGVDYEILTVTIIDSDVKFIPYGRYFGKDIRKILDMNRNGKSVLDMIEEENLETLVMQETRPLANHQAVYRLKKGMIDFDTAVDCGFGIVRVLRGKYKGQFFLYNTENEEEDVAFMLDVYFQIAVNNYDNKNLEKYIQTEDGKNMLRLLQNTDDGEVLFHKLDMAFIRKKGGNNVIPIVRKE